LAALGAFFKDTLTRKEDLTGAAASVDQMYVQLENDARVLYSYPPQLADIPGYDPDSADQQPAVSNLYQRAKVADVAVIDFLARDIQSGTKKVLTVAQPIVQRHQWGRDGEGAGIFLGVLFWESELEFVVRESVLPASYGDSLQPYVEIRSLAATEEYPTGQVIYRESRWPDEAETAFDEDQSYQQLIEQYFAANQEYGDLDQPQASAYEENEGGPLPGWYKVGIPEALGASMPACGVAFPNRVEGADLHDHYRLWAISSTADPTTHDD